MAFNDVAGIQRIKSPVQQVQAFAPYGIVFQTEFSTIFSEDGTNL
jgi:hypothetical protein